MQLSIILKKLEKKEMKNLNNFIHKYNPIFMWEHTYTTNKKKKALRFNKLLDLKILNFIYSSALTNRQANEH